MKTRLILTALCGLLFTLGASARESPGFALSFNRSGGEYHNLGAGRWGAPAAPEGAGEGGLTIAYYSGTLLASMDLSRNGIRNIYVNPHFHLTATCRSEAGFRMMLRIYPVAGVCNLADKDSVFDYGAVLTLCTGRRVGGSLFGRVTRHSVAGGVSFAF